MMEDLTSLHKDSYGGWAGRPNGSAPDPSRCAQEVRGEGRWAIYHQCNRKRGFGPEGAYCKQHDPEAIAKRDADRRAQQAEDWQRRKKEAWGASAIALLQDIAAGHNDARGAASEWLRGAGFPTESCRAAPASSGAPEVHEDDGSDWDGARS